MWRAWRLSAIAQRDGERVGVGCAGGQTVESDLGNLTIRDVAASKRGASFSGVPGAEILDSSAGAVAALVTGLNAHHCDGRSPDGRRMGHLLVTLSILLAPLNPAHAQISVGIARALAWSTLLTERQTT
jgi:hypothetical protein